MTQSEFLRYAFDMLKRHDIPHMLVGSIASGAYGEMRFTYDIDIVVDLKPEKVRNLCEEFPSPQFYASEPAALDAVKRGGQFNVIEPSTNLEIDFMLSPRSRWGRAQMQRRREEWIYPDLLGYVAAPEDIILSKLQYYREGDSEKHPRDIACMLTVSPALIDRTYIESWLGELQIREQWSRVLERMKRT